MIPWKDYQEPGIPDLLIQYRAVQEYPIAIDPCPEEEKILVGIRSLFKDRNPEYWKQRTSMESAFLDWKKAEAQKTAPAQVIAPSSWSGQGLCPTCKRDAPRTDSECVKMVERWLEEHGEPR